MTDPQHGTATAPAPLPAPADPAIGALPAQPAVLR